MWADVSMGVSRGGVWREVSIRTNRVYIVHFFFRLFKLGQELGPLFCCCLVSPFSMFWGPAPFFNAGERIREGGVEWSGCGVGGKVILLTLHPLWSRVFVVKFANLG